MARGSGLEPLRRQSTLVAGVVLVPAVACGRIGFDAHGDGAVPAPMDGSREPTCPVLDTFDVPDGPLGPPWTGETAQFRVQSSALVNNTRPGERHLVLHGDTVHGVSQCAFITLEDPSSYFSLVLKSNAAGDSFFYGNFHVAHAHLGFWDGDDNDLTSPTVSFERGDRVGVVARADGRAFLYRNGDVLASADYRAFPRFDEGGRIGIATYDASRLDDFGGGSL